MIVESHMHVGDDPTLGVSMDRADPVAEVRERDILNTAIDVAERNPNVYLESTGMPVHSKTRQAVERVCPDRVLYGSDTSFHHPSVELAKVRVSGLSTDLTDRVLGEIGRKLTFGVRAPEIAL